jgi:aldehyde dehydrogenase (NAD+)
MENDLEKYQIFIGNEWHDSATEETFESYNPYTGEPWAKIPKCDARDVDAAVDAAHDALYSGPWGQMPPTQRGALMRKLAELIQRDADKLATVEVRDNGKLLAEVRGQVSFLPENSALTAPPWWSQLCPISLHHHVLQ